MGEEFSAGGSESGDTASLLELAHGARGHHRSGDGAPPSADSSDHSGSEYGDDAHGGYDHPPVHGHGGSHGQGRSRNRGHGGSHGQSRSRNRGHDDDRGGRGRAPTTAAREAIPAHVVDELVRISELLSARSAALAEREAEVERQVHLGCTLPCD